MKKNSLFLTMTALLAMVTLLAGCIPQGININISSNNNVKQEDESSLSVELGSAKKLDIENQTGSIIVKKSADSSAAIKTKIRVEGQVQEEVEKVIREIKTTAVVNNDTLEIRAVCSDGTDFWRWKQSHYRMLNVNITFEVSLPNDLEAYRLGMITGNIKLEGLSGSVNANNVTGNITLQDTALIGSNKVKLITGNIDINASINEADSLDVVGTTGNISMSLPSDASLKLEASIVTGSIKGSLVGSAAVRSLAGSKVDKTFGDGKTSVALELVTGNMTISKR